MRTNESISSCRLKDHIRIVCIADTHELHRKVDVPDGDLLIHAGDFTQYSKSAAAIGDFNEWLGELPHLQKLLIPGNHEFFLEADPNQRGSISNATILINDSIEMLGLKIWGSPTTPLYGGAFGLSSEPDRVRLYSEIPAEADILITHSPPFGILDRPAGSSEHQGCPALLDRVRELKPKLHVFGHVHGSRGTFSTDETLFVNAALLGIDGDIDANPIVIQILRI
ncbi:MAG: metallophosphatase domain-containing protein [Acidobacteriaceae bacterium]